MLVAGSGLLADMTVIRQELLSVVQLEEYSLKIASVVLGFVLITFLCSLADL